ncbi:S-layer homology domain-containing protein [Cohnella terricola]|uniref:S-layer homology domain-containing protein n=1 Tax=Cohnella terricola TaxID=1289167 RepID=A0A559JL81_9BACL|nr:S-layer homology domain-containing protein [Cohnella terricola]TVY00624.1 S-layer homology domain-containing protein [Cohnella terricola]
MMNYALKRPLLLLLMIAVACLSLGGSAFAHNGQNSDSKSNKPINVATAVSMIVKGLELNIDGIRFFKEPKASDYFKKVKDDAPYAKDFIIAQYNGLDVPKDINPAATVTREQFAKWLYGALSHKGSYSWIQIYQNVSDADQISKGYMDSIQKLLIAKIVTLDSKQKFHPKNNVTKPEAAIMIAKTVKFLQNNKPAEPENSLVGDVSFTVDKETDNVSKVTLSATVPHSGYGFEISGIRFEKDEAIIQYRIVLPDPDGMYLQVLKNVSVSTYIASNYKVVLEEAASR